MGLDSLPLQPGEDFFGVRDLERLLREPGGMFVHDLRLDPIYDALRGRADFRALVGE